MAEFIVSNSPVIVSIGIIWCYADGLVIVLDGSLMLTQFSVSEPPVTVKTSTIRCYANGLVIMINSLQAFSFGKQGKAEIVMRQIIILCHLQSVAKESDAVFPVAALLP